VKNIIRAVLVTVCGGLLLTGLGGTSLAAKKAEAPVAAISAAAEAHTLNNTRDLSAATPAQLSLAQKIAAGYPMIYGYEHSKYMGSIVYTRQYPRTGCSAFSTNWRDWVNGFNGSWTMSSIRTANLPQSCNYLGVIGRNGLGSFMCVNSMNSGISYFGPGWNDNMREVWLYHAGCAPYGY
jgi:hypothetical protein